MIDSFPRGIAAHYEYFSKKFLVKEEMEGDWVACGLVLYGLWSWLNKVIFNGKECDFRKIKE